MFYRPKNVNFSCKKMYQPIIEHKQLPILRKDSSIQFFHVGIFFLSEKHFTSANCWRLHCWGWSAPYGSLFQLPDRHCSASHPVWRLCLRLWQSMGYVFCTSAPRAVFLQEKGGNISATASPKLIKAKQGNSQYGFTHRAKGATS